MRQSLSILNAVLGAAPVGMLVGMLVGVLVAAGPTGCAGPPAPHSPKEKPMSADTNLAPDFSLPGSDGQTYSLADYRGKQAVVVAWFPVAFTGG